MAADFEQLQYIPVKLYERAIQSERREICSSPRHRVTVHHPGYESTRLFEISAFDGESGGIHHSTLLLFCGIIAGGLWNGWLSETKNGPRLTAGIEDVLMKSDYYFHLPDPKWPVVLSLDHLAFPHGHPPPGWTFDDPESSFYSSASVSSMSQAVKDRDMTCRVTRWADGIERAHLCPRSALNWFTREELERYNISATLSGPTSIDDMANAVALRRDVHVELDKHTFVFVRKLGKWVSHFLDPTHNLGPEHHNVPIDMPTAVSEAFVFANVADAVLSRISNFLMRGEQRKVIVKRGTAPPQPTEMTGAEIRNMLDQSKRERSKSPRKRLRNPDMDEEPGDAPDGKRRCSSWPTQELHEIPATPTLTVSNPSSDLGVAVDCEVHPRTRLGQLRWEALKKQRRLNKNAATCCDYDAAESVLRECDEGQLYDAELCLKCLGAE